jgi:hypothetical protein
MMTSELMSCPKCGDRCERDSVDVGVGVIRGPYGCPSKAQLQVRPRYTKSRDCASASRPQRSERWSALAAIMSSLLGPRRSQRRTYGSKGVHEDLGARPVEARVLSLRCMADD